MRRVRSSWQTIEYLACVVLLVGLDGVVAWAGPVIDLDPRLAEVVQRIEQSIVRLQPAAAARAGHAAAPPVSGLVIANGRAVLTTSAIGKAGDEVTVLISGRLGETAGRVAKSDPKTGLAIVQLDPPQAGVAPLAIGGDAEARDGDLLIMLGFRAGPIAHRTLGELVAKVSGFASAARDGLLIAANTEQAVVGGAVIDSRGQVVGLVSGTSAPEPGVVPGKLLGAPLSFAIPAHAIDEWLKAELAGESREQGWLGLYLAAENHGIVVEAVADSSPASGAGILPGDIITGIDDTRVATMPEFIRAFSGRAAGQFVSLDLQRGNRPLRVRTQLMAQPGEEPSYQVRSLEAVPGEAFLGVTIGRVPPAMAEEVGSGGLGALVTQVEPGSAAEAAGIVPGDVLLAFDNHPIAEHKDLGLRISTAGPGDRVRLTIRRGSGLLQRNVELGRRSSQWMYVLNPAFAAGRIAARDVGESDEADAWKESLARLEQVRVQLESVRQRIGRSASPLPIELSLGLDEVQRELQELRGELMRADRLRGGTD